MVECRSYNDVTIADSWTDYDVVGTGYTYTRGLIQFEISCELLLEVLVVQRVLHKTKIM